VITEIGALKDHSALVLGNGAVALTPRHAFPYKKVESAWCSALAGEAV
jgi:hypothetical protein